MDDIPLQKIQISGPTLASILQRFSSASGDIEGLLFGSVAYITPSTFADDDPTTTTSSSFTSDNPNLIATITHFISSNSTSTFSDSAGNLSLPSLHRLISSSPGNQLIGWLSGRRHTPHRPSLRESCLSSSLSSQIQLAFQANNSPKSFSLPPSIFLLLTTPFQDQLIHTHEYRAYQFRLSTELFEPKTLDVVNIGPAFRGQYGAFCPSSPLPALPCELTGPILMVEERKGECQSESLQRELDLCAEGFVVGQLSRLMGTEAANYTTEVEDLYKKMLAKLDGLARLVEKSSTRVLEQENLNMKLRIRVAGLE
ncbi:hypothetical protein NMG60_11000122 [Bertholletia excelsa]